MAKNKNPSWPWVQAVTNFRASLVINCVQGVVIVGLVIALLSLLPLKTYEPIYVEFQHSTNSFVVVQRAGRDVTSNSALLSMFLRSYVSSREMVDKVTERERWQFVLALSSENEERKFRALYNDPEKSLFYKKGHKRFIHIVSDESLGPRTHQLIIETTDLNEFVDKDADGKPDKEKNEWIVTLRYDFYEQLVTLDPGEIDPRLLNPMGLLIEEYSIRRMTTSKGD